MTMKRRRPKMMRKRRLRPSGVARMTTPIKQLMLRRPPEMSKRLRLPEQMKVQARRQRATSAEIVRINVMMKLKLRVSLLSLPSRMTKGGAVEGES